eukprot:13171161-Ditylum_brightwellii.AAC.1
MLNCVVAVYHHNGFVLQVKGGALVGTFMGVSGGALGGIFAGITVGVLGGKFAGLKGRAFIPVGDAFVMGSAKEEAMIVVFCIIRELMGKANGKNVTGGAVVCTHGNKVFGRGDGAMKTGEGKGIVATLFET